MIQIEHGVVRVDIRSRRRWAAIGALVGALLILPAAPIGAAPAREAPQGIQAGTCQPDDVQFPLEMNTVAANGLWKTLAQEKELFRCRNADGTEYLRDLQTYIEIIEKGRGTLVEMTVQVSTCFKAWPAGNVQCKWNVKALGTTNNPIEGCEPHGRPQDPVEMNTVVNQQGTAAASTLIKTIKVDKDIWECGQAGTTSSRWADLYIFSELIEALTNLPNNAGTTWRPVVRQFLGVVCYKDWQHGSIERCARYPVGRLTGGG